MKFAIIKSGSKQYKVSQGDEILVEKLDGDPEKKINFAQVLLFVDGKNIKVGTPVINSIQVQGKIKSQEKAKKIRVATFKAKSRYRKVKGHRQQLTRVIIEKIGSSRKSTSKSTVKAKTSRK